jgi:hypothetical protein
MIGGGSAYGFLLRYRGRGYDHDSNSGEDREVLTGVLLPSMAPETRKGEVRHGTDDNNAMCNIILQKLTRRNPTVYVQIEG